MIDEKIPKVGLKRTGCLKALQAVFFSQHPQEVARTTSTAHPELEHLRLSSNAGTPGAASVPAEQQTWFPGRVGRA
jgi:hypothetical protein